MSSQPERTRSWWWWRRMRTEHEEVLVEHEQVAMLSQPEHRRR